MPEKGEEWPSARWMYIGCPFSDEERLDLEQIERDILEEKLRRACSCEPDTGHSSPVLDSSDDWFANLSLLFGSSEEEVRRLSVVSLVSLPVTSDESYLSFEELSDSYPSGSRKRVSVFQTFSLSESEHCSSDEESSVCGQSCCPSSEGAESRDVPEKATPGSPCLRSALADKKTDRQAAGSGKRQRKTSRVHFADIAPTGPAVSVRYRQSEPRGIKDWRVLQRVKGFKVDFRSRSRSDSQEGSKKRPSKLTEAGPTDSSSSGVDKQASLSLGINPDQAAAGTPVEQTGRSNSPWLKRTSPANITAQRQSQEKKTLPHTSLTEAQPSAHTSLTEAQPSAHTSLTEAQPSASSTHTSLTEAQPSASSAHTSLTEAQPSASSAHTSLTEAQPSASSAHTSLTEAQPSASSASDTSGQVTKLQPKTVVQNDVKLEDFDAGSKEASLEIDDLQNVANVLPVSRENSRPNVGGSSVTERDESETEREAIENKDTGSLWRIIAKNLHTILTRRQDSVLQQSTAENRPVEEADRRPEKSHRSANIFKATFSPDSVPGSSCSDSDSDSAYGSFHSNWVTKIIETETAHARQVQIKREATLSSRQSIWATRPGVSERASVAQTRISPYQRCVPDTSSNSIVMSSKSSPSGINSGKYSAAKDRKEKEKEKRDKEKERKEKEKEKREEKKEKEKEKREKDRKEREEREKERKDKEERERDERRHVAATVVTQAEEPVPEPDDGSDFTDQHSYFGRVVHTLAHLLFISLLLLTIGSLGIGVGSLFATSALEVAHHFQRGVTQASFVELGLALVGFLFFLLILALTVLSAVMLVPALWVTLIEIIVCPWSVISDYFLP